MGTDRLEEYGEEEIDYRLMYWIESLCRESLRGGVCKAAPTGDDYITYRADSREEFERSIKRAFMAAKIRYDTNDITVIWRKTPRREVIRGENLFRARLVFVPSMGVKGDAVGESC